MPSVFPDRFAAHPKWLRGHRWKTPSGGWRPDGQWQDLYHLSKMTLAGRRERQMELYAGSRMEQGNSTVQRTTPLKQNMIAWRRCTLAPDSAILR